jgi:lipoprotein-releasing system permease protein
MAISITIGLIVMVAALNIIASLVLLVMEKSRDIAILKTMGTSSQRVMRIFMLQGLVIGIIGTVIGGVGWRVAVLAVDDVPADSHSRGRVSGLVRPVHRATARSGRRARVGNRHLFPGDDLSVRQASRLDPVQALAI